MIDTHSGSMEGADFECGFKRYLSGNAKNQAGSSIDWAKTLKRILTKLESPKSTFSKTRFTALQANEDRFKVACLDQKDVIEDINAFIEANVGANAGGKSREVSDNYRRLGNEAYAAKKFTDASYLYTLAIIFAPTGGDIPADAASPLALAYGNRSALFFELAQWDNCIKDIDMALEAGHKAISKLLLRKIDSLISSKRLMEAVVILGHARLEDHEFGSEQRLRLLSLGDHQGEITPKTTAASPLLDLPSITSSLSRAGQYDPSASLSSLSSKLEVRYSPTAGRYLVAKADIEPGDIVAVEVPYSSTLLKPFELAYCHHCCRRLEAPASGPGTSSGAKKENVLKCQGQMQISGPLVPCSTCTSVLYCSSACRDASWSLYHRFECSILVILHEIGIAHLALRMLLSTGLETIGETIRAKEQSEEEQYRMELTDPIDYSHVAKLVHHTGDFTADDLLQYSLTVGLLTQLAVKVGAFGRQDEESLPLAGGILLRHILQLVTNAHAISHFISSPESGSFWDSRIASAIYPSISLLNHSCQPNVVATFEGCRVNLLRACRRIGANEEVLHCYGAHFGRLPFRKRQDALKAQYFFDCGCARCQVERINGHNGQYYPLACGKCRGPLPLDRQSDASRFYHCSCCGHQEGLPKIADIYTALSGQLESANETVRRIEFTLGKGQLYVEEFTRLESLVAQMAGLLHADSSLQLGRYYDDLSHFYNLAGDPRKSKDYAARSCAIVERNYGPTSIELACELIKLADLESLDVPSMANPSRVKKFQQVTQRALTLLRQFAFIDTLDGCHLVDESCFFTAEYRRLERRLLEVETKSPKQQVITQ